VPYLRAYSTEAHSTDIYVTPSTSWILAGQSDTFGIHLEYRDGYLLGLAMLLFAAEER